MPELAAEPATGIYLRLMGSLRDVEDSELPRLYGYPVDRRGTWVRANFVASLDGAATVEGKSAGLAGAGDRAVFRLLRELADVILVGAGTVRVENYAGAQLSAGQRQQRQARGQAEVPPLAVVTRSGQLDHDLRVFRRPEVSPLVLTCTASTEETRRRLAGLAEVIDCSGDDPGRVDESAVLAALEQRGLLRILTEGGPTLLNSFIKRDLLDDLCLTVAPCIVGGQASRISSGSGEVLTRMRCAHILTDEAGYLYTRYLRGE